ncbi:hypothetical protein B0H17DRAFT_1125198 [Mycena rosella]|uniref:Uncharacterized protein n=1 Tax=Mycena rosella TaxID=1033263 RepID=A0AAD7GXK4_MYCRO|nr:hypothetical protein B0H17DRAFT_1125198 [Mycena rosella]
MTLYVTKTHTIPILGPPEAGRVMLVFCPVEEENKDASSEEEIAEDDGESSSRESSGEDKMHVDPLAYSTHPILPAPPLLPVAPVAPLPAAPQLPTGGAAPVAAVVTAAQASRDTIAINHETVE